MVTVCWSGCESMLQLLLKATAQSCHWSRDATFQILIWNQIFGNQIRFIGSQEFHIFYRIFSLFWSFSLNCYIFSDFLSKTSGISAEDSADSEGTLQSIKVPLHLFQFVVARAVLWYETYIGTAAIWDLIASQKSLEVFGFFHTPTWWTKHCSFTYPVENKKHNSFCVSS